MSDVDEQLSKMRLKIEHGVWRDVGSWGHHKSGFRAAGRIQSMLEWIDTKRQKNEVIARRVHVCALLF